MTHASGTAEDDAAVALGQALPPRARRRTLGADDGYDVRRVIEGLRATGATPDVAEHATNLRRTIGGRTTRHTGYAERQRRRKLIEEGFGRGKTVGLQRKLGHRGRATVHWVFAFTHAAHTLGRIRTHLRAGIAGPSAVEGAG